MLRRANDNDQTSDIYRAILAQFLIVDVQNWPFFSRNINHNINSCIQYMYTCILMIITIKIPITIIVCVFFKMSGKYVMAGHIVRRSQNLLISPVTYICMYLVHNTKIQYVLVHIMHIVTVLAKSV